MGSAAPGPTEPTGPGPWWSRWAGTGCWRARPAAAVAGNATGAGDAVAAALAHGLVLGRPWDERLRHAVALGAATAAAPVAGEFRSGDYTGALAAVTVEQVSAEEVG